MDSYNANVTDESSTVESAGASLLTTSSAVACPQEIPVASQILNDKLPSWACGLLALFTFCSFVSLIIFVEEIVFLTRRLKRGEQLNRTIWILALYPIYTVTAFLSLLVPRSGTLINLVANTFFASAVYQVNELLIGYLGGPDRMWKTLGESREITIRTLPCCCCCFCLPRIVLNKKSFQRINALIIQFVIIRPVLLFIAAVLWTNNSFIPGYILPDNAFIYIAALNLISTLLAMWALVILRNAFSSYLDVHYSITGKVLCVQVIMVTTSAINIFCGILVTTNVIKCTSLLSSRARGDQFYHEVLTVVSCILGIIARFFYRRESDTQEMILHQDDTTTYNVTSMTSVTVDDVRSSDVNGETIAVAFNPHANQKLDDYNVANDNAALSPGGDDKLYNA